METNLVEILDLVFEVSHYRSEILSEVDRCFAKLKKDNKDLAAKKELIEKIKNFSGVKNVILTLKKDYTNAAVIPIYNQSISLDLVNLLKNFESGENLKNLTVIEEPSKYIDKIYLIIGLDLINMFSPKELTSILLHEFGHVYTYTSNLPRILLALFQKFIGLVGTVLKVPLFLFFSVPAYMIASIVVITLSRSLTFLEHKSEYRADQFAIKYGYGDEFISVLHKLHNKHVEIENKKAWYQKLFDFINQLFVPSSHPTSAKRIEEMSGKILDEYKKLYPKLDTELNIILNDIRKQVR